MFQSAIDTRANKVLEVRMSARNTASDIFFSEVAVLAVIWEDRSR